MKYVKQFFVIVLVSFLGEILNEVIPLPVPASIYGLLIMLLCLCTKIIKVEDVKQTSTFLLEIMPMMFIPAAVGLITAADVLKANLVAYAVITVVTTVAVMASSGLVTQFVSRRKEKRAEK